MSGLGVLLCVVHAVQIDARALVQVVVRLSILELVPGLLLYARWEENELPTEGGMKFLLFSDSVFVSDRHVDPYPSEGIALD